MAGRGGNLFGRVGGVGHQPPREPAEGVATAVALGPSIVLLGRHGADFAAAPPAKASSRLEQEAPPSAELVLRPRQVSGADGPRNSEEGLDKGRDRGHSFLQPVTATGYSDRFTAKGADGCPTAQRADATAAVSSKSAQLVSRILKPSPSQERLICFPTEFAGIWLYDPLTIAVAHDPSLITAAPNHVAAECAQPWYRGIC